MRLFWNVWMCIGYKALSRACDMVALPRGWVVGTFRPRCPPRTSTYASGTVVYALPQAARCDPSLCRRLPDANKILAEV